MKITVSSRANFPVVEVTPFRLVWVGIIAAITCVFFGPWAMIPVFFASLYIE